MEYLLLLDLVIITSCRQWEWKEEANAIGSTIWTKMHGQFPVKKLTLRCGMQQTHFAHLQRKSGIFRPRARSYVVRGSKLMIVR